jgi:hypothetical protein
MLCSDSRLPTALLLIKVLVGAAKAASCGECCALVAV